jgi:uncharacterized protein with HEPN domain
MRQSEKTDIICVGKILKYIGEISDCFEHFNISSCSGFKESRLSQLAITQLITNIYSLKQKIKPDTLPNLPEFDRLRLVTARNIASHDYERVNFEIIYDICKRLTSKNIVNELTEVIRDANNDAK